MNHCYSDILSRIKDPPLWFDENAVPRWCKFEPGFANIYAREAVLGVVRCQACHREFHVAMSCTRYEEHQLSSLAADRQLHYGDPPNVECCDVGLSMNSEFLRVLEFWSKTRSGWDFNWTRVPELEGVEYDP